MMNTRCMAVIVMAIVALLRPVPALSQHQHGGGSGQGATMAMETRDVLVDNIKVSFAVMDNQAHRKMLKDMKMKEDVEAGTTHNINVVLKDQNTQQEITNAVVSMRVVKPNGEDEIKTLKYEDMMKSYDAYFNLPEKGKYQILVLFRFGDEKKTAGIYYDVQ